MMNRRSPLLPLACLAALFICIAAASSPALAQIAHHPFAVGAGEAPVGHQNMLGAMILAQESRFYRGLTAAVRGAHTPEGAALLMGLSFLYGIFHAAGPGHGKAVITSYLVSNEVALRRGFALALLAAILQGLVAVGIVTVAALIFNATAGRMTAAAQTIEGLGYVGIVGLGLVLVWRKGRALFKSAAPFIPPAAPAPALALADGPAAPRMAYSLKAAPATAQPRSGTRFVADDGSAHPLDCTCGSHFPDPARISGAKMDWRTALVAVATAGARPCSGAMLVLIFALSQGLYVAGVASTFAMSLGTALTTGGLAALAVLAKDVALSLTRGASAQRRERLGRIIEFAGALAVLLFGIALLAAFFSGPTLAG